MKIKRVLLTAVFISLLPFSSTFAAQQEVVNGETMGQARTKINANDTELYGWGDHSLVNYTKYDEAETLTANWINTAFPWADNEIAEALTIVGGSVDSTPIGDTTPDTGAFTEVTSPLFTSSAIDGARKQVYPTNSFGPTSTVNY